MYWIHGGAFIIVFEKDINFGVLGFVICLCLNLKLLWDVWLPRTGGQCKVLFAFGLKSDSYARAASYHSTGIL